jgi:enhancing lycopene biosynthesis protein 2
VREDSIHAPGSARNVRGTDLDALVLPGGFGAAKNLSDFALAGARAVPHPQAVRLLREMHQSKKPIGAICIAPAVVGVRGWAPAGAPFAWSDSEARRGRGTC